MRHCVGRWEASPEGGTRPPLGAGGREDWIRNLLMSIVASTMPVARHKLRPLVDPAVFAERLISHERLERMDVPEDDLLGLRNVQTGEVLFVSGARFRSWLGERC
jgi:hypothetical protein